MCENCESFIQKTYTFALENGKDTEDVDISVDGNFVQYHVQDNDTEVWVIDDFNTVSTVYIQIQKNEISVLCTQAVTITVVRLMTRRQLLQSYV